MDKSLVRDGYNRAAETYLQRRDQFKNNAYLEQLTGLLRPQATILDIGCGAGKPIDRHLVDHGFKVIGLDISEKQIELARANVPEASYAVKDMSDLREGDYQVDAVVSFYAIFHTPRDSHARLFHTINSFLPSGGLVLVTMGSSDWEGVESDFCGVTMEWSHYDSKKNREIVAGAGFKIILDEIDASGGEKHQVILAEKISPASSPAWSTWMHWRSRSASRGKRSTGFVLPAEMHAWLRRVRWPIAESARGSGP